MKHDFEWPVIPLPIHVLPLDAIGDTLFYVGDGTCWVLAARRHGLWRFAGSQHPRLNEQMKPQPTFFLAPADDRDPPSGSAEPRAGWHCGNHGLAARYLLLLIERNPSMTTEQMDWIADLIERAGSAFSAARLDVHTNEEVPL